MKKKLLIVILIFIVGFSTFNFYSNYKKINSLETEIHNLNSKIKQAQKKNQELKEKMVNVQSNEFIEKNARTKLGLVKPGEVLVIPIDESKNKEKEKDN